MDHVALMTISLRKIEFIIAMRTAKENSKITQVQTKLRWILISFAPHFVIFPLLIGVGKPHVKNLSQQARDFGI
jgi:hypothetical protein